MRPDPATRRSCAARTAAALAVAVFLSACGQKDVAAAPPAAATADETVAEASAESGGGPAMWLLSDEDSEIYLFGTFHILPSSLGWESEALADAMKATPNTMTEVDTKSPAAQATMAALVQQLGVNSPGVTLSSTLGEERAARFARIAEKYGASMSALESLKPWLATLSLSVLIMQKEGFNAESGAEATILARAAAEGDDISHLESAEYQIRALASLDEREILADFDTSLEQFEEFSSYADRVLDAWKTGDVDAIDRETLAPMRKTAPGAYKILIADRNANWVGDIESMMKGSDDYFIAVGAGHLVGPGSVIDMLEKRGHAIRRVQ